MADPMTALGLASNIVQLISFTSDIVSKSREIYKSQDGKLIEHMELEAITTSLHDLSREIVSPFQKGILLSKAEEDLQKLWGECNDISRQLIVAIESLQTQGRNKKWNSFRQALKTVWKEDEIEALSRRLDRYRAQIDTALLVSLTAILREHIPIQAPFNQEVDSKVRWAEELIEAIRQHQWELQSQKDVAKFSSQVSATTETQRKEQRKGGILDKLRFTSMGDRYERIEEAHRKTFEWIFVNGEDQATSSTTLRTADSESLTEPLRPMEVGYGSAVELDEEENHPRWSSFPLWLLSNEGIYWITGKPGSGKSTLMKYLYNEHRTLTYLHQWSGDYPLVTAGFFFWNSGAVMQMSKMGLLQALLYELIQGHVDLVPSLFPDRWRSYELFGGDVRPWSWSELSCAFDMLLDDTSKRFCFFIDGLDEFDGDCAELAKFVLEKSARSNVKMCVASRPWLVFEDAFQCKPSLRLEDLTARDIRLFTSETLRGNNMFIHLEHLQPQEAEWLIVEVTGKASGVFLWVRLVVLSLLEGLQDGDTITDLYERLLLLPSDLEQLFLNILKGLKPFYFEQASKLFQYVRAAQKPLSLLSLSFAEDGFKMAMSANVQALPPEQLKFRGENTRRRLISRCKGLLEASTYKRDGASAKVQYFHRTVKDFLHSPKIWQYITSEAPNSFDPDLMLCGAFLRQIKSMRIQRETFYIFKWLLDEFSHYSLRIDNKSRDIHLSGLNELDRAVAIFQSGDGAILLAKGGSSMNFFFDYAFNYPLHTYVEHKLSAGYSANSQIDVNSLLYIAATSADVRMVGILLDHGADPNIGQSVNPTAWQHILRELNVNCKNPSSKDLKIRFRGIRSIFKRVRSKKIIAT
ncbi:uncharacterized protein PAC_13468 [Phialocephala subalpina]|uniref:Uncharacterized protein n=1 Tax=Phialocephala subalpina TaxID=576137 RepID=A0A1L7XEW9_9HELO|nr:uncharacterized protein PAC_13468 [Phialocephala subalpina]